MTLDEIREALQAAGLERLAGVADHLTLPAIRIEPTMVNEDTIPVGASKLGGRPDLPPDMAWPERDGRSLGFLAQFNLAEVAPYDIAKTLPPSGMLYFFYDFTNEHAGLSAEDRGACKVIYAVDSALPSRKDWPANLTALHQLPSSRPDFSVTMTLTQEPSWAAHLDLNDADNERLQATVESLWQADMKNTAKAADLDEDADEGMEDDEEDNDIMDDEEDDYEYKATRHQLLGYPVLVYYGGMPWVCELVSSGQPNPLFGDLRYKPYEGWDAQTKVLHQQAYEQWRLLFQLGNITGMPFPEGGEEDDDPVWKLSQLCDLWARGGLMYFWIERDRLAQRDFSNVWMLGASQL